MIVALALRAPRRRRIPQHRRRSSTPTARWRASTARCTSRTIPLYYEKFYFTPGDLGFRAFDTRLGRIGDADLLGPVVSRGGAPDGAARRADSVLSHGHRLASRAKRRSSAPRSATPGAPSSAATPSPTASTSRPSTASAMEKTAPAATASSSGDVVRLPIPSAWCSPRLDRRGRNPRRRKSTPRASKRSRRNWPFLRDRRIDAYKGIEQRFLDGKL